VLLGCKELWSRIDYIVCEISESELYEGMANGDEMIRVLADSFYPIFRSSTDMVFTNRKSIVGGF
jgi:hypothetical protein